MHKNLNLVPRPPPFFVLRFSFSNTRKRKSVKNGEGLGTPITRMTSGEREVEMWGEGFTFNNTLDFIIECSNDNQDS